MPEQTVHSVPIGAVAGPYILIYCLNWGLFGVLCVQVFLYYLAFSRDRWTVKVLAYGVLITETVQTILITNDAFTKFGLEFSNVKGLAAMRHHWFSIPVLTSINATAVQLFFAHHIWKLSRSRILGLGVAFLAIVEGVSGIVTGVQAKIINDLATVAIKARVAGTIWLIVSAVCDVMIAVCMTVILSRKKSGFNVQTDDAITKVIRLFIETGTLTGKCTLRLNHVLLLKSPQAAVGVLAVGLYLTMPKRSYWNVPLGILGKLYSNNLMVILNRRLKVSDSSEHSVVGSTPSQRNLPNGHTSVRVDMPGINVQREVWSESNPEDPNNIKLEEISPSARVKAHPYLVQPATNVV
ncbi:hypothetical protein PM082_018533 [Marasmius tenuissimus]|nr:hypothetical protein PM082_018533 [Marasmius tenuissimus]